MGNSYIKISRLSFSGKQTAPTLKRKRIIIAKFAEKSPLTPIWLPEKNRWVTKITQSTKHYIVYKTRKSNSFGPFLAKNRGYPKR
jgi:hypothetical protein